MCTYIHTYIYVCMYTYVYIYTYVCVGIYMRALLNGFKTIYSNVCAAIRCLSGARTNALHCNTLQTTATHCNTLQHNSLCVITSAWRYGIRMAHNITAHCNTLRPAATHCNKLQHAAK